MARKVEEQCMFCGMAPCECDGVAKPKKAPKPKPKPKMQPKPKEESKPTDPVVNDSSEDIFGNIPERRSKFTAPKKVEERDWAMELALNAIRPLATTASQYQIDQALKRNYPLDVAKRIRALKGSRK